MVKNLKQENNTHGEELNTAQYAWCRDDTELYMWQTETKEDNKLDDER